MTGRHRLGKRTFEIAETDLPLIATLPGPQQAALGASGSYEDCALALGWNIGTFKSRYNRACTALVALRAAALIEEPAGC